MRSMQAARGLAKSETIFWPSKIISCYYSTSGASVAPPSRLARPPSLQTIRAAHYGTRSGPSPPLTQIRTVMSSSAATSPASRIHFSTFDVTDQVFLRNEHVVGIVNLKPIVPCHVLLIPPHPSVKRLADLPSESLHTFLSTIQSVVATLERVTGSTSSTVAIQDGPEAGQSVDHLHVHILPRKAGDFVENDEIYARLEEFGFDLRKLQMQRGGELAAPDADEDRRPRTREQMQREARWLSAFFDSNGGDGNARQTSES